MGFDRGWGACLATRVPVVRLVSVRHGVEQRSVLRGGGGRGGALGGGYWSGIVDSGSWEHFQVKFWVLFCFFFCLTHTRIDRVLTKSHLQVRRTDSTNPRYLVVPGQPQALLHRHHPTTPFLPPSPRPPPVTVVVPLVVAPPMATIQETSHDLRHLTLPYCI